MMIDTSPEALLALADALQAHGPAPKKQLEEVLRAVANEKEMAEAVAIGNSIVQRELDTSPAALRVLADMTESAMFERFLGEQEKETIEALRAVADEKEAQAHANAIAQIQDVFDEDHKIPDGIPGMTQEEASQFETWWWTLPRPRPSAVDLSKAWIAGLAAAPKAPEVGQWRPIETAPKDEAYGGFLVRVPSEDGRALVVIQVSNFEGVMYPDIHGFNVDREDQVTKAVDWMPLPEGPKS